MEKRRPWMKWYPSDWRADEGLRSVSFAARGLWADLLTLMHKGEPYGHLLVNERQPTTKQLAQILGGTAREVESLLTELEQAGVFSRLDDGTIYNRRMVRDRAKEDADRENGKAGGNPRLTERDKGGVNPPDNPQDKGGDKAHKPEARSQRLEAREAAGDSPGFAGKTVAYTATELAELRTTYPGLDVPAVLREIDAWLEGHPEAKRNWRQTAVRWLARECAKLPKQTALADERRRERQVWIDLKRRNLPAPKLSLHDIRTALKEGDCTETEARQWGALEAA